jgi:hypothetical protein
VSLTVKFKGDSSSFDKALNKVKSGMNSVKAPVVAVAKTVAVLGAAFTAAAAAAGAIIYKLVKIGEEANTQNARLANITKQMGLFGGEAEKVSERLSKFAEAQARLTGTDNAAIKQGQAFLMTFKDIAATADEVGGNFDRATVAAIDLAAGGFGSLERASLALGKILSDPINNINALAKAGVQFTEQEKEKIQTMVVSNQLFEAQAFILDKIKGRVGETAQATANATDKLAEMRKQLMNAFAKPVADAFDNLSMNAEKTFVALESKFAESGKIFANALGQAVAGDASRIAKIGELIGGLLMRGIMASLKAGGWSFSEGLWKGVGALADTKAGDVVTFGGGRDLAEIAEGQAGDARRFRGQSVASELADAVNDLSKSIDELRKQEREDAVYKAGFRAGGTDRITDSSKVDQIFDEFLDETKKTNQLLQEFAEERKGP